MVNTSGLKTQEITSKKINFIMAPKILLRPTGLNNSYTTSTVALPPLSRLATAFNGAGKKGFPLFLNLQFNAISAILPLSFGATVRALGGYYQVPQSPE